MFWKNSFCSILFSVSVVWIKAVSICEHSDNLGPRSISNKSWCSVLREVSACWKFCLIPQFFFWVLISVKCLLLLNFYWVSIFALLWTKIEIDPNFHKKANLKHRSPTSSDNNRPVQLPSRKSRKSRHMTRLLSFSTNILSCHFLKFR